MKASCLRSPLLMGCLLLSLAGQGVCEERRVLRFGSNVSETRNYSLDIVKHAAKKLNWKFEHFECPWKRCLFMMGSGEVDMMGRLFKTPEREKFMYYVEPPYFSERIAFYFLQGLGAKVREYRDLMGLSIAVLRGSAYFEPFDSDLTLNKKSITHHLQRYKMLQAGRIDTFIGNELLFDVLLKQSEFKNQFEKAPYQVSAGNDYFTMLKKSPYAKDRLKFDEVLKQLIDSGKVKEIFEKYGTEWNPPTQQAPK